MIYIYDSIVDKNDMTFEYLGVEYKLKGVTRTGSSYYLTYQVKGREPILVMPLFVSQFAEVAKKFDKIKDCTTDHNARLRLKKTFRNEPEVEIYDFGSSKTYHYAVEYKSIKFYVVLSNSGEENRFFLMPSFTIMKDNIFGDGLDVDVRNNPEIYKYCDEE